MARTLRLTISALLFAGGLFASKSASHPTDAIPTPWFTGPILTPSGHIIPKGYINVEPYIFYNITNGAYDSSWRGRSIPNITNVNFQVPIWIGLTPWMDVTFTPQASWNSTLGVSDLVINDFPLQLEFQLLEDTLHNTLPGIKLYIGETFPVAPYQRGDPRKLGTDIGGEGSFQTYIGFALARLFYFSGYNFLSTRFNVEYTVPASTSLKGLSTYGGTPRTRGRIRPGQEVLTQLGLEYSVTRNFVLACDFQGTYNTEDKFHGRTGGVAVGRPERFQFSLAPGLEWNFSEAVGLIGGGWFSFAGKNAPRFFSGVIAINYFGPAPKGREHKFRTSGGGGG